MRMIAATTLLLTLISAPVAAAPTGEAQVETGIVRGIAADGVVSWKGIPFAAPPIGPLRWRAHQPAAPWAGVRSATT